MSPGYDTREPSDATVRRRIEILSPAQRAALRNRLSARAMSGARLLAEGLRRSGVTRVIGICGTPVDQVFADCAALGIRPIGAREQRSAVLMAASANYVAGRLESVVVVSAGPAVTNTLTGVLVARDNGWPVVVIGGRRPLHREGIGYFQELDACPIFQSVTKWAATIERTSDVVGTIVRACEVAASGRPGPVYLDLPEDVVEGLGDPGTSTEPAVTRGPDASARQIDETARLVLHAERPLLILGDGVRWSYAAESTHRLVEDAGIPFITAPMARGFLPDDHPLCANDVRRWIQAKADVVLMAGASFDYRFRFGAELRPAAKVVHVDVEPSMLGRNIEAALAIRADSGRFLQQLASALGTSAPPCPPDRGAWHALVAAARLEAQRAREAWASKASRPMGPHQLLGALRELVPPDATLVLDGNIALSTAQLLLRARRPCGWLDPGWNGCMGAGIPFGMGARLVSDDRLVVVICGDFGFGLSVMEFETAVRHAIPIVAVVVNNDGIGGAARQRSRFPPDYPERFSHFQTALRYERMVTALGGHGEWVSDPIELGPAFARAVASGLPACINVGVDPLAPHPGFW